MKRIIAIEGPNGAGKTTLWNYISSHYDNVSCIKPLYGPFAEAKDLKGYMIDSGSALGNVFYFMSSAIEQQSNLGEGEVFLLDRSIWSTLASAYSKDKAIADKLFSILEIVSENILLPTETVLLNADYNTCRTRIGKKDISESKYDKDSEQQFNDKMFFYQLLQEHGYPIRVIDTINKSEKEVQQEFDALKLL